MDKIKRMYTELSFLNERIELANEMLNVANKKKKELIESCSHDLVLAYKEKKYGDLFLWECECLLCKERLDLTLNQRIYSFGDKKALNHRIDLDNIIDIIACVSKNTREQYVMGGEYKSLVGERARKKLVELINGNKKLTKEEIKFKILTDLMLFDHNLQNNGFKEYTNEEVRLAIQPDNIEKVNALGTESVDLCSEGAKKKIK